MITSKVPNMNIEPKAGSFILLVGPRSLNSTMLNLIARLPAPVLHRTQDGVPQAQVAERSSSAPHPTGMLRDGAETANPTGTLRGGGSSHGDAPRMPPWPALRILDGGNRFNAYTVARLVGGRPEVMNRITVSRAFTCYQVLSLLESTPANTCPFIVLDLLNTFYDESVQAGERKRLLRSCIAALHRLTKAAGGVVSVHPPAVPSQAAIEFLKLLQASTEDTYFIQPVPPAPEPLRLF